MYMYVIVTCKYEMDPLKNSREKVEIPFSHYKSKGIFSAAQGQITLQSFHFDRPTGCRDIHV